MKYYMAKYKVKAISGGTLAIQSIPENKVAYICRVGILQVNFHVKPYSLTQTFPVVHKIAGRDEGTFPVDWKIVIFWFILL